MLDAMKDIPFNAPEDVVTLTWNDLKFNEATGELIAPDHTSATEFFAARAKARPHDVAKPKTSERRPSPKRSKMSYKEKADFITRYGEEAFVNLPL